MVDYGVSAGCGSTELAGKAKAPLAAVMDVVVVSSPNISCDRRTQLLVVPRADH